MTKLLDESQHICGSWTKSINQARERSGRRARVITLEQSSDFRPAQLVIHHVAKARGKKGD